MDMGRWPQAIGKSDASYAGMSERRPRGLAPQERLGEFGVTGRTNARGMGQAIPGALQVGAGSAGMSAQGPPGDSVGRPPRGSRDGTRAPRMTGARPLC